MSQTKGASAGAAPPNTTWTLILGSLGAFVAALDVVVVATALPTLQQHFHASLSDLEWTINAYNLAFACLMLTGSALGDRFGRRNAYSIGLLIFVASSIWAAVSTSATELIFARVVEGAGAAAVLPLSLTLISEAFPPEKRGAAIGIWGGVTGMGVSTGPVVGGLLIKEFSWQWIFWINVPVGLSVAALSMLKMRESRGPRPQLDPIGLVLVGLGMFGLVWAAVRAPDVGWIKAETIAFFALGLVFVAAFVAWERRAPYPMVPLHYFKIREFTTANSVIFFQFMAMIGTLFMLTQLFQIGMGYDALGAGLRMLVWVGTPAVVAPVAGLLADKFGNKPFMLAGVFMQGTGMIWLAIVAKHGVTFTDTIAPLIYSGAGSAMCFPTVANAVAGSVPMEDVGVASGTNSAMRELGGVFGVAILAAVFAHKGGYASPNQFVDGFRAAMYAGAVISALGVAWALFAPSKRQLAALRSAAPTLEPALAGEVG